VTWPGPSDARGRLAVADAARVFRAGDLSGAEQACRQILRRDPRDADALQLLGTIALRRGADEEAARCYRRCLRLRPREPHFHYLIGKLEAVQGRFDRAVAAYDRALELLPGYPLAVGWRAWALERLGRGDEAIAGLAPLVDAEAEDPTMAEVYASCLQSAGRLEEALPVVDRQLDRDDLAPLDRKILLFRRGQVLDRAGRHDEAFAAFAAANALLAEPFDPDAHRRAVDALREVFGPGCLETLPRARSTSEVPVFIAGMPRSGTTLVEQVVDAHPLAFGAGELTDLDRLARDLPAIAGSTRPWPHVVADLTPKTADRLSRGYLAHLGRLGRHAKRVVNKSLTNVRHLGLAALLWPRARIVRCRRDPLDTCLSCYFSHLLPETNPFASDLRHLGLVHRATEALMDHWAGVLDLPIHEVRYDEIVADPERVIRGIIEFLGLPWDDRCLRFHETGRAVTTLSYDQVRRPIYTSSLGRWRNYDAHLGPLREGLGVGAGG
jgi:tetratricopeptide (TPR) repeat protein